MSMSMAGRSGSGRSRNEEVRSAKESIQNIRSPAL
jgi:hypothetical protein